MSNKPIFIIFQSQPKCLSAFIKYKILKSMNATNKNIYSVLESQQEYFYKIYSSNLFLGEITWFYSLILFLENNNYPYIHSENKDSCLKSYEKFKSCELSYR